MKKLFTFFTMCLLMATMAMAETTITFDASVDQSGNTTAGEQTLTKDGITLHVTNGILGAFDQSNSTYAYRIYKDATLTVSSIVGAITNIEFTCAASGTTKYGPGCMTADCGTYTYADKVGTWTGSSSTIKFTASTAQVRAHKIVVTVGGGGEETVANPTFTPAAGTYYNPINVEIKSGTTGANIYYTLDGTTPSASSTAYSEAIAISQNTTIKAIAIKGDKQSQVSEAAYVFEQATQVNNIAAFNQVEDSTVVTFTNPVVVTAQHGNYTYVKDESGFGLIFKVGKTYKDGQSIPAGFTGMKVTYSDEPEMVAPLSGFETGIDGPAPEAEEIQCEDVSADLWAHYVVIKGAKIDKTANTITDASGSAPIHTGMGGYGSSTDTTKVYDVYAVIGSYRPASATETIYQVLPYKLVPAGTTPTEGLTIAEFQALADGTDTEAFNAVTTLAQSGSRLFVKDETGYMLIYGSVGKTYNTGDIIPAGFSGQKTSWDGEPELKNPKDFAESTESTTVKPVEANAAYLKHENFAHYVVFKNATISGGKIYDAAGAEVAFYCNMGVNLPADETKTYDIYGIVGSHGATNTVYQLLPTEFKATDGSEEQIPEVADVEALYDLNKGINARIKSDLVAIYQHGNRLFVKNNDTYTLVYGTLTETFENGDIIRDAIASWSEYQGAKQLVPVDSTFVVAEKGAAIEPIEMPLEEMGQDMVHTYFLVKNATLTTTETENTYMVNDGTIDMKAFNQFGIEMPEDLEAQYDIKCFLTVYKQELELYPVEITKVGGDIVIGDTNNDGKVDITDVNNVINMMLGKAEMIPAADTNNDGKIDITDVNNVINLMLGK